MTRCCTLSSWHQVSDNFCFCDECFMTRTQQLRSGLPCGWGLFRDCPSGCQVHRTSRNLGKRGPRKVRQLRSHIPLFCVLPHGFSSKGETARRSQGEMEKMTKLIDILYTHLSLRVVQKIALPHYHYLVRCKLSVDDSFFPGNYLIKCFANNSIPALSNP